MNEPYNPDPAFPPSMTLHARAMQIRAVEEACQPHISDLAMTVALEVWKLRESSAKQIARCLDETLVGRIARLEEAKTTLTKRWEDVCKAAGALSDATNKEILGEIEYACRNYGKAVRIAKQEHLDVKDWALAILRRSSVTDFPDKCEYARWVRSVACAAAEGKEKWLEQLENEFCTYIANNAKERAAE